uniref:S5 DRBM domain-containing protein n=1 Tax=Steinernema glaseri TaxID=37863 RepID=A0A1I7YIG9_9BILA
MTSPNGRRIYIAVALVAVLLCPRTLGSSNDDDESDNKEDRVVLLNNEGETNADTKGRSFATTGLSYDDVVNNPNVAPPLKKASLSNFGHEYSNEKPAQDVNEDVQMRFAESLKKIAESSSHSKRDAYKLLAMAAEQGHTEARKLIAFSYLFGDYNRWSIDEARAIFEELAAQGSPDAQLALGYLHSTGMGVAKANPAKGLVYYNFAALGGNPLAMMALGYRHMYGVNVPADCEKALEWYQKVASKVADKVRLTGGVATSRVRLPDEAEATANAVSSITSLVIDSNLLNYYKYLAEKGDVQVQTTLGQMYLTGSRGLPRDPLLANHYFTTAAEQGHTQAYAYLGRMFLEGTEATPQDNMTAYQYFKKAADKGNPIGQSGLGVMYLYGRGVEKSYSKAYELFHNAAEQGWVDGQLHLGFMFFNGLGVKRDPKAAIQCFQKAAQSGHVLAYYNLAQMHAKGTGVARSCPIALEYYKNVAERGRWSDKLMEAYQLYKDREVDQALFKYMFMAELGYEVAQTNVAYILDKEQSPMITMFERNEAFQRAINYWRRSANQEYAYARLKLGDYYYYGLGTEVNMEEAVNQYKVAGEHHNLAQALFNLGYMHESGLGMERDLHLAKRFYDRAAQTHTDAIVPSNLALCKLATRFAVEYLRSIKLFVVAEQLIGPDWELFVGPMIAMLIAVLAFFHMRR